MTFSLFLYSLLSATTLGDVGVQPSRTSAEDKFNSVQSSLGVSLNTIKEDWADALKLPDFSGEFVQTVLTDSSADRAGIHPGDVIVSLDNRPIAPNWNVFFLLHQKAPGTRVSIGVVRHGEPLTVEATLFPPSTPDHKGARVLFVGTPINETSHDVIADLSRQLGIEGLEMLPRYGLQLGLADPNVKGVVISRVLPDSDAHKKGLMRGDIVTTADFRSIENPSQLEVVMDSLRKKSYNIMIVTVLRRGQEPVFLPLKFK